MDGDSITVEVLINGVSFKPALIDTGCECYSIVDKDLVTELWLPRVKIPPKPIIGFVKENIKEPWVYYRGGRGVANGSGKNKGNSGMGST